MVTDLGEQPTPETEPSEPAPGGVDAVEDAEYEPDPLVPDLAGVGNTASMVEVPEEITEPEVTDEGASTDGAREEETQAAA